MIVEVEAEEHAVLGYVWGSWWVVNGLWRLTSGGLDALTFEGVA